MKTRKIPLYYPFLPKNLGEAVKKTIDSGWINTGPKAREFEERFKEKFNFCHALAVNSCTSALRLAYAVAGVGHNDQVITTPHTMVATNTTILEQGAKPIFADIQYKTGNIDPNDIEHRINSKTKAIVVVHMTGYPCDMDEIWKIASHYNLPVIEDCAHAIGAKYKGHYVGELSDIACFSFQTIKQITTGDGGMFVTVFYQYAKKANRLRWFGMEKTTRYTRKISELGFKYDINDITATMGIEGMKYINRVIKKRLRIAKFYRDELKSVNGIKLMEWKSDRISGNWLFPIHVQRREKFFEKMRRCGIGTNIAFKRNDWHTIFGGVRKDLPNMDRLEKDIALIPIHCNLTTSDLHYIVDKIKSGW